jgi:hypothetical protein
MTPKSGVLMIKKRRERIEAAALGVEEARLAHRGFRAVIG